MWADDEIDSLSPHGKLFYMYLLTSPLSNIAGYYRLPVKQIVMDTGIDEPEVRHLLTMNTKLWKYDMETKQVLIPNFLKYNKLQGSKLLKGMAIQVQGLARSPLHVDFMLYAIRYAGDQVIDVMDPTTMKYINLELVDRKDSIAIALRALLSI